MKAEDTRFELVRGCPQSGATWHLSFEPRTREQVEAITARSIDSARATPRTEYCLAVTRRGEHRLIGYARLATEPQQAATIGFALHPAAWGKGLAASPSGRGSEARESFLSGILCFFRPLPLRGKGSEETIFFYLNFLYPG
ncbi:GNAT family N-acetyltransferase [Kitasatospora sp. NPDC001119]